MTREHARLADAKENAVPWRFFGPYAIDEVSKAEIANKDETDITIDYKVDEGTLKGFWLRLRGAWVDEESKGTTADYRIILNYEIPLYEPETSVS